MRNVTHIVHDSRDIVQISTYGNGLFAYDLATESICNINKIHFTSNFEYTPVRIECG